MTTTALITSGATNGREFLLSERARRLERAAGDLVYCGPGPADGALAYLDAASGAVVVLFVARLSDVGRTLAFFELENESLRAAAHSTCVIVRTQNIQGIISVGTPALVGPIMLEGDGYLDGAAAWSM